MDQVIKLAAKNAGKVLLEYFRQKENKVSYKSSHQDFYTQADIESQETVKRTIIAETAKMGIPASEIGFIGEENLHEASQKHLFIIDPLDGTTNFESGLDIFAVSIAYCLNGEITAGVVYRPTTDDLYHASKNGGAFKNSHKLTLSAKPLSACLLDGIISSRPNIYPKMFKILQDTVSHTKGFRSFFCMTLVDCYLAENILNITINSHTFIWDIAAANLIVSEAGGVNFDFEGKPISLDLANPKTAYNVVSCHESVKAEVLNLINRK